MNFSELGKVIEVLGKDRGIKKEVVVGAIEQAFLVTARKKFGIQGEYEARYNEDDGEVEIFQYKNVVNADSVKDPIVEIDFSQAQELDEEYDEEDDEENDEDSMIVDDEEIQPFTRINNLENYTPEDLDFINKMNNYFDGWEEWVPETPLLNILKNAINKTC